MSSKVPLDGALERFVGLFNVASAKMRSREGFPAPHVISTKDLIEILEFLPNPLYKCAISPYSSSHAPKKEYGTVTYSQDTPSTAKTRSFEIS